MVNVLLSIGTTISEDSKIRREILSSPYKPYIRGTLQTDRHNAFEEGRDKAVTKCARNGYQYREDPTSLCANALGLYHLKLSKDEEYQTLLNRKLVSICEINMMISCLVYLKISPFNSPEMILMYSPDYIDRQNRS
ncbi:hypothetical protein J6590_038184 [Homalodisca vitripennis]|nr:hypothetical protein J6590_038184 [Homalodisca vitripennis]